jgi:hypothetical protein
VEKISEQSIYIPFLFYYYSKYNCAEIYLNVSDMAQESFRHWQSKSIDQKQNASSLLLALSGAALGFSVSLLPASSSYVGCVGSICFQLCILTHLISIVCGVAFSVNRVRDFDLTAQIVRKRDLTPNQPSLKKMRATVRRWGRISRRLYMWQGISFVLGALGFVVFAVVRYLPTLYPI